MVDKYANFAELSAGEVAGDYKIVCQNRQSDVVIAAPHGGSIEPGTSEIAMALAGDELSYYLFEGHKAGNNRDLHITSARFDEPQGLALMRQAKTVITIHGEASSGNVVYVGGLYSFLSDILTRSLIEKGFVVQRHSNPSLQGTNPENICNIGTGNKGVQLELSQGVRKAMFSSLSRQGRSQPTAYLTRFCQGIREALEQV